MELRLDLQKSSAWSVLGPGFQLRGKKQLSKDPLERYTCSIMTSIQVYSLSSVVLCFLSLVALSGSSISIQSLFPVFLIHDDGNREQGKANSKYRMAHIVKKRTANSQMKHRVWIEQPNGRENERESETETEREGGAEGVKGEVKWYKQGFAFSPPPLSLSLLTPAALTRLPLGCHGNNLSHNTPYYTPAWINPTYPTHAWRQDG